MTKKKVVFRGTDHELAELTRDALEASSVAPTSAPVSPVSEMVGADVDQSPAQPQAVISLAEHQVAVHAAFMEGASIGTDGWKTSKARHGAWEL